LIGKIRYFFWSAALSGALLIYGVVTGSIKKTITTMVAVRTQGAAGLPEKYREGLPMVFHEYLPNIVKKKIPCHVWANVDALSKVSYYPDPAATNCKENTDNVAALPKPDDAADDAPDAAPDSEQTSEASTAPQAVVKPHLPLIESKSASRADMEGGKYVEIDGKYYEKRADHIYNINNVRIYFENNRRYVMNDKDMNYANRITKVSRSAPKPKVDGDSGSQAEARNVDSVSNEIPEDPSTPSEMVQVLQKAQDSSNQEQEMLKNLDREK
jgi:hypothetical protein